MHTPNELTLLVVKTFLQCPKYNPQQIKSCSKASVEHYPESGTICSIQNRKLVFQNELEKCDILNMQLSELFDEPSKKDHSL